MKTPIAPLIATLTALAMAGCASHPPTQPVAAKAPPATAQAPATPTLVPFAQRHQTLANGVAGRLLTLPSANPVNYEDMLGGKPMAPVRLEARLYLPKGATGPVGAVIIAPGSGGVAPPMLAHASALTDAGLAVLLVDPFGGRGVVNTIAAQDAFSFAASTHDVFAAMKLLAADPAVDPRRIGAMGYSRGGISVLQAAVQPLAKAVLGDAPPLKAVLAGWPWCGYQFQAPVTAPTAVRFVMGDRDNWVSPQQCQGYADAMRGQNPQVSARLVRDAFHGFGYGGELRELPQALKALNAPTLYFDPQGRLLDPWSGQATPGLSDTAIAKMLTPFLSRGATVGSQGEQMQDFMKDFTAFFSGQLR